MADQTQFIVILRRAMMDDVDNVPAEILKRFDQDNLPVEIHEYGQDCGCDPEVFMFETENRWLRHRRDC